MFDFIGYICIILGLYELTFNNQYNEWTGNKYILVNINVFSKFYTIITTVRGGNNGNKLTKHINIYQYLLPVHSTVPGGIFYCVRCLKTNLVRKSVRCVRTKVAVFTSTTN